MPVALGLLTLASCNSNDLLGDGNFASLEGQNALIVETEPMIDEYGSKASTRALSNVDGAAFEWQDLDEGVKDRIKVYDKDLHKYDIYQFNGTAKAFMLKGANDVNEPLFALYPSENVEGTDWVKNENEPTKTVARITLPNTIVYSEAKLSDGTQGYHNELPQWGTVVEGSTTTQLKTDLHWLTAFLRIKVAHVKNSATRYIKIKAFSDPDLTAGNELYISGLFKATLDPDNVNDAKLSEYAGGADDDNKQITIDFGEGGVSAANDNSVIFVPIPADLVGYVALYAGDADAPFKVLSNKKYVKGTRYGVAEFDLTGEGASPKAISGLLTSAKNTEGTVNITATAATTTVTDGDNKIIIPAGMKASTIKINLKALTGTKLSVENEDASQPFAGNVVFYVGAATVTNAIDFNLTGAAAVTLAGGDAAAEVPVETNYSGAIKVYANAFILGDGTNGVTKATGLTLSPSQVQALTVSANATMGDVKLDATSKLAAIVVEGTAGAIASAAANAVQPTVTVSGEGIVTSISTGEDVTILGTTEAEKLATVTTITKAANVSMSGNASVTTITTAKDVTLKGAAKVGTVTATGDVEVDVDAQDGKCEAITTALKMGVDGKTLTLKQGYIKTVAAIETAQKKVNLTFGTDGAYQAIGSVTGNLVPTEGTVSKWNKKAVPTEEFVDRANYFNSANVWTASQLADLSGKAPAEILNLKADLDLDGGDFAGLVPGSETTIAGNDKTISNIAFVGKKAEENFGAGLVAYATTPVTINNLNLSGVKLGTLATGVKGNLGAFVGQGAAVTLNRVKATFAAGTFGFAATAKKDAQNIGGAIGSATGVVTINGIDITATGATFAGYANIGGIIGKSVKAVTIAASPANPGLNLAAFDVKVTGFAAKTSYVVPESESKNDNAQGTAGYYIGSAALPVSAETAISIPAQTGVTSFAAEGEALSRNFVVSANKAFTFERSNDNPWIGYCGVPADITDHPAGVAPLVISNLTIGTQTKWVITTSANTTTLNDHKVLYNVVITDVQ